MIVQTVTLYQIKNIIYIFAYETMCLMYGTQFFKASN